MLTTREWFTEKYLKDMSREMGANHVPVAKVSHRHMFDTYLGRDTNCMVYAPRQSGKTSYLIDKFIRTPNSLFLTVDRNMCMNIRDMVRRHQRERTWDIRDNDILVTSPHAVRGTQKSAIFIDEFAYSRRVSVRDFQSILIDAQLSVGSDGFIQGISTPKENFEMNIETVCLPYDYIDDVEMRIPEQHFDEGLFRL